MEKFNNIQYENATYQVEDPEAVKEEGGELENTVVTYDEEEESEVSSWTDFLENHFKSGGKIGQWFRDFKEGAKFLLHVGSLVNNCTTDNSDLPLAAAQGKVLMDLIETANGNIASNSTALTTAANNIATLQSDITSAQSELTQISNDLSNLVDISSSIEIYDSSITSIGYAYYLAGHVYIQFECQASSGSNDYAEIKSPYRPSYLTFGFYNINGKDNAGLVNRMRINTSGIFEVWATSAFNQKEFFTFSYPISK